MTIEDILKKCADTYYNQGSFYDLTDEEQDFIIEELEIPCQATVSDAMFDAIQNAYERKYGKSYSYVGSPIERTMGKVKLPFVMGSMNQLHNDEELMKWINPLWQYCCSAKLDGCSVGLVYREGKLVEAYTRGDGYEGQNILETVKRFGNHFPKTIPYDLELMVRGEIIVPKTDIPLMIQEMKEENGKEYANGRNGVAGAINSKIAPKSFVKYAHLVCYHIEGDFVRESEIFELLEEMGFETPEWAVLDGDKITGERMTQANVDLKNDYMYEVDGTIITQNLRLDKGYDTGTINPKMSKKYKVGCVDNYAETKVTGIKWSISKDGFLKPVVQFIPVQLDGTTVSNATGNNYKNIIDNKISVGSTIRLHKSGLIIPFIDEVVEYAETENYDLPNMDIFTSNGVDLVLNKQDWLNDEWLKYYNEILFQKTVYFCSKMGIEYAGEGNLRRLLPENLTECYTSNQGVYCLINYSKQYMIAILGVNGGKLYDSLHKCLKDVSQAQIFDALGSFGRGIGEKKLQKLIDKYETLDLSLEQVIETEGFAEITASQFIANKDNYKEWFGIINSNQNDFSFKSEEKILTSNVFQNIIVVFTGIRDKEMEARIITNGGKIASSLTKDVNLVITKDVNSNSSKITKARERGIEIISYDEAKERF